MSYALSLAAAAAIGLVLWGFFRRVDPSRVTDYAGCRGWCEAELADCGGPHPTRVPEQPVNTYTNLAYAAAGVWVALEIGSPPAGLFAVAMVLLCVGSSLYHGVATRGYGRFDVGAMYAVFSSLAVFAFCRALALSGGWTVAAMLVLGAVTGLLGFVLRSWYAEGVALKVAIFLIVPYLLAAERIVVHDAAAALAPAAGSFALFAAAMTAWQLDRRCLFPLRRWGHGLWHLLTAAATALLFLGVDRMA